MQDKLLGAGVFESWIRDKKTGLIIPGSHQVSRNTITQPFGFHTGTSLVDNAPGENLSSAALFDTSENDPDNIDSAWVTAHGTNGVLYGTLPSGYNDSILDVEIIASNWVKAACKTIGTSVAQDDSPSFVLNGELDGPFTDASGYFMLTQAFSYSAANTWGFYNIFAHKQQALDIASTRTYYFKWTISF